MGEDEPLVRMEAEPGGVCTADLLEGLTALMIS